MQASVIESAVLMLQNNGVIGELFGHVHYWRHITIHFHHQYKATILKHPARLSKIVLFLCARRVSPLEYGVKSGEDTYNN